MVNTGTNSLERLRRAKILQIFKTLEKKNMRKKTRGNESISYKGLAAKENAEAFSSLARRRGKH